MKITTSIVEGLTAFLVKVLLRPKVYYVEPPKHPYRLDEPSLLIINHTCHLDGPVVTTVFRKDRIHNLAAKDRFEQRGFEGLLSARPPQKAAPAAQPAPYIGNP